MRARSRTTAVALLAAGGLALSGCGLGILEGSAGDGAWSRAPTAPLGPREHAVAVWTGREVLVAGGSDAPPCPPGAACRATRRAPLRDGAAFNPRTGRWRGIANAPVGFALGGGVVAGSTVFVGTPGDESRPGAPPAVLAYRVDFDRWRRLPAPPGLREDLRLVAAGERLVAYGIGGGRRDPPGYLLHRDGAPWRPLPADPLPRTQPQTMVWSGRELVLFGSGPAGAPLARAAALRLGARRWRRLPDAKSVLYGGPWVRAGSRLISPALGDGGDEYRWGRPRGGILDPRAGTWGELPDPPEAGPSSFGAGVLTPRIGTYFGSHGWLLDSKRERWVEIPRLPSEDLLHETTANAGRSLFVFGGARFNSDSPGGKLLKTAWIWSPPGDP